MKKEKIADFCNNCLDGLLIYKKTAFSENTNEVYLECDTCGMLLCSTTPNSNYKTTSYTGA